MPSTCSKKRRLSSGLGVRSSACPMCARVVDHVALHAGTQAVEIVGQSAPLPTAPACRARSSARSREAASTSSRRSCRTTTTPSRSSTTVSPGRIVVPPTSTGSSIAPTPRSCSRPFTRIQRAQVGTPSSCRSDASRTAASTSSAATPRGLRLCGEEVADQCHRLRLGHGQHEHVSRLRPVHDGMHHQVVALPAPDGARGAGGARAGDELAQVQVHQALASGGLVHGRGAEARELVHSSDCTCGSTRMNASA